MNKYKFYKMRKFFVWVLLLLSVSAAVYSLLRIEEIRRIYAVGDRFYEQFQQDNVTVNKGGENPWADDSAPIPQVEIIPLEVDFAALKKINADTVAWLYCPGTSINYPVMRAKDYNWYLWHLPDGRYNANGSLFLDYNCPDDFSGLLSVIYGHNMKSGKMFHDLTRFKKQAFYDEHPFMYLYIYNLQI